MKRATIFILLSIVATHVFIGIVFADWYLIPTSLRTLDKIAFPFVVAILICLAVSLFEKENLTIIAGIICVLIASLISYSSVKPLDSDWDPIETIVLSKVDDHHQIVVLSTFNPKHNTTKLDTVLVEDFFIFRKEIHIPDIAN